jgi:hypothetical protein
MALRIVPFEPAHLPIVRRFSERTWSRPKTDAYYRWRYLECPSLLGYLALDGDECVASLWAFLSPYRIAGRDVTCLETHDWFCRPDLRGSGIGVRLMQTMMRRTEPIVTVGAGPDTLALLPRLKWRSAGDYRFYALPLEGGALGAYVARRTGLPAAWARAAFRIAARPWFAPRPSRGRPGGVVEEVREIGAEVVDLYRRSGNAGIVPLPDPARIRWFVNAVEELGRFLPLQFRVDGTVRGWSFARVYRGHHGPEATLVDLFADEDDDALHDWMISETLARLLERRPDTVRAGTSSPALERALLRHRFRSHQTLPINVWPHDLEIPPPPHLIANNTADMPLFPYPDA